MQDFTRRALLQGGTALAAAGALTGPALFDFAKAWAQSAPWKAEPGAKLTVMRWKRFVPAEDDAFNAMVAAFKAATGTEMNVFSESFEDVQPKASVAANTGSGLDIAWGLHTLAAAVPDQGPEDERRRRLSRPEIRRLDRSGGEDLQERQRLARHSRRDRWRLPDLSQIGGREGWLQAGPDPTSRPISNCARR